MGRKSARLLTRPAAFAHPVRGPKSARLPAHTVLCAFSRPFFSLSSPLFPPPFALTRAAKPAIIQHGLFASRRTSGRTQAPKGHGTRKFEAFWLIRPQGLASHGAKPGVCVENFRPYLASKSCICPKGPQDGPLKLNREQYSSGRRGVTRKTLTFWSICPQGMA